MSDRASSSLTALAVVLASTLLCGAAAFAVGAFSSEVTRAKVRNAARLACDAALSAWISSFHRTAGEADSGFDDYAGLISWDGAEMVAEDISSRINLALVRPELIGMAALSPSLRPDASALGLAVLQEAQGAGHGDVSVERALSTPEATESLFTLYSFVDLNSSDRSALERIYALRSGDSEAAAALVSKLDQTLSAHRRIESDELRSLLSPYFEEVFPVICVAPPYNVNFAPAELLEAVLAMPEFGITDHPDRASALLASRSGGEVTSDRLRAVLGIARENPVYDYLGVKTWFWKVRVNAKGASLEAIIARIPPSPGHELKAEKDPDIRVVAREYSQ